jgi:hypothetical protein
MLLAGLLLLGFCVSLIGILLIIHGIKEAKARANLRHNPVRVNRSAHRRRGHVVRSLPPSRDQTQPEGLPVRHTEAAAPVVGLRQRTDSVIYYRTKDGLADYGFSFECQRDGTIRAYISSQPSYGSRDSSLHATHRLSDAGRHYICWTDPLWSEEAARQVAALWADSTQEYIKTGRRF